MPFKIKFKFWDQEHVCWRDFWAVGYLWKYWNFVFSEKNLGRVRRVCGSVLVVQ
jgi:hypothetical protein